MILSFLKSYAPFSRTCRTDERDHLATLEAKARARLEARKLAREARRRRHTSEAQRAYINATSAQLAAEMGKGWPA